MWTSIDLVFVWVAEIDLVLYAGRKLRGFSVSIEIDFVFVWVAEIDLISMWGIELDLISVQGLELTWFLCEDRNDLVLVLSKSTWLSCRGIKIDLNINWGPRLTGFQRCVEINFLLGGGADWTMGLNPHTHPGLSLG